MSSDPRRTDGPGARSRARSRSAERLWRSSAFRIALGYSLLFAASAIVLLGFVYFSTASFMARQADEAIDAEIALLAERYRSRGATGLAALIRERIGRRPTGWSIYLMLDGRGRPVAGNLSGWPNVSADEEGWLEFRLEGGEGEPVHRARARGFPLLGGYRILVGRDMHEIEEVQRTVLRTLLWGLALTVGLAVVGGMVLSRGRLRRIAEIDRSLQKVMGGDLSTRIPPEPAGDDIEALVDDVNQMLDELERLFDGTRRVSDSIAHDLRTPLQRLKTRLERLRATWTPDDPPDDLVAALRETDGLLETFSALLRIARIEAARRRAGFSEVVLEEVAGDVAELYEPLFEDAGKSVVVETPAVSTRVEGDPDLLFQAVANLVDNALKHVPGGGTAQIFVSDGDGDCGPRIGVADHGPGIPPVERPRVVERFYRLEAARTGPGSGLGLSLVLAVAELHRAELVLDDNRPGLRAALVFLPNR